MSEKLGIFKVDRLTEGGFVTVAPNYSQFSETLDLAFKRLIVQAEAVLKEVQDEMKDEAKKQEDAVRAASQPRPPTQQTQTQKPK